MNSQPIQQGMQLLLKLLLESMKVRRRPCQLMGSHSLLFLWMQLQRFKELLLIKEKVILIKNCIILIIDTRLERVEQKIRDLNKNLFELILKDDFLPIYTHQSYSKVFKDTSIVMQASPEKRRSSVGAMFRKGA